jgi:hypothetical protein
MTPAPTIGTEQFTDEFLDGLREVGDPPADEAVATFFNGRSGSPMDLFQALAATAAGQTDEQAPGVGPFVARDEPWPTWAVPELVARGQKLFCDWGPQFGLGLWMASLPADYAGAKGAEPLVRMARLTQRPKRRLLETGQMILDAMTPGGLDAGKRGKEEVRHVRLMHAAVRYVLLHAEELAAYTDEPADPWDDALGKPVNQEDLLGALFSFSLIGLRAVVRSGVQLSADEEEAYVHVWNVVGHLMGVREDLLPLNHADAEVVFQRICDRQYHESDAGRELTKAAVDCMQDLLVTKRLRGLPATGIRHYLGDELAELLGVDKADWTRLLFLLESSSDNLFSRTMGRLPGARVATAYLGRQVFQTFELLERGPNRPNFEISEELRQAWSLAPRDR